MCQGKESRLCPGAGGAMKGFEPMNEGSHVRFQKDQEGQGWVITVTQGNVGGDMSVGMESKRRP